ncbi:MAG: hypothetical protein IKZ13_04790 [Akkermansia sp.]|nr:hypothetical protein [Akkermansia sp.]
MLRRILLFCLFCVSAPAAFGLWGAHEGEHASQYLLREVQAAADVLLRGRELLPVGHGLLRLKSEAPVPEEGELDEAPELPSWWTMLPEDSRHYSIIFVEERLRPSLYWQGNIVLIKADEIVMLSPAVKEGAEKEFSWCRVAVPMPTGGCDMMSRYLKAAEAHVPIKPKDDVCDFVSYAAAVAPHLLNDSLLHVVVNGKYIFTALGLLAEPSCEYLPMERPLQSLSRWFNELQERGQYENELDWMYKTIILPHFMPEMPASTQKPRDKSPQKE